MWISRPTILIGGVYQMNIREGAARFALLGHSMTADSKLCKRKGAARFAAAPLSHSVHSFKTKLRR
ncbi:MAG: hypothetical protein JWR14_3799 [Caballeronia sp.]|nr:hypothetical protein [Caballeronia sp.]